MGGPSTGGLAGARGVGQTRRGSCQGAGTRAGPSGHADSQRCREGSAPAGLALPHLPAAHLLGAVSPPLTRAGRAVCPGPGPSRASAPRGAQRAPQVSTGELSREEGACGLPLGSAGATVPGARQGSRLTS